LFYGAGTDTQIKRGSGLANGLVNSKVAKATDSPFSTRAFSVNYSDNGLFGVHVVAPREKIDEVVRATSGVCKEIAAGSIPKDAVEGAKQRLKASLLMSDEKASNVLEDIAVETAVLGTVPATSEILAKIDAVTTGSVTGAAKKALGGKMSLTTVGKGGDGPYLCEL